VARTGNAAGGHVNESRRSTISSVRRCGRGLHVRQGVREKGELGLDRCGRSLPKTVNVVMMRPALSFAELPISGVFFFFCLPCQHRGAIARVAGRASCQLMNGIANGSFDGLAWDARQGAQ